MSRSPKPVTKLVVEIGESADLERALAFYERALMATDAERVDPDHLVCRVGSLLLLLTRKPAAPDRFYTKGRTPRLELIVEGVDEWLREAEAAGARIRVRERADGALCQGWEQPAVYAQIHDPYGHLWSFAERHLDDGRPRT